MLYGARDGETSMGLSPFHANDGRGHYQLTGFHEDSPASSPVQSWKFRQIGAGQDRSPLAFAAGNPRGLVAE
jgi:hypothetical protein